MHEEAVMGRQQAYAGPDFKTRFDREFRANVYARSNSERGERAMDISILVFGAAVVMCGLGALMEHNANRVKRQRRLPRSSR